MSTPQLPSYLSKENIGPWHIYLQQVEQVAPLTVRQAKEYMRAQCIEVRL